jgi:hypothetical protein
LDVTDLGGLAAAGMNETEGVELVDVHARPIEDHIDGKLEAPVHGNFWQNCIGRLGDWLIELDVVKRAVLTKRCILAAPYPDG